MYFTFPEIKWFSFLKVKVMSQETELPSQLATRSFKVRILGNEVLSLELTSESSSRSLTISTLLMICLVSLLVVWGDKLILLYKTLA